MPRLFSQRSTLDFTVHVTSVTTLIPRDALLTLGGLYALCGESAEVECSALLKAVIAAAEELSDDGLIWYCHRQRV